MQPLPCPTPTCWTTVDPVTGETWIACTSVVCPTPTPAVVPTLADQGLWLFATLVLCVGIRLISLRHKEAC